MFVESSLYVLLGIATGIAALLSLVAHYTHPQRRMLGLVSKPLATIFIITLAGFSLRGACDEAALAIVLGLLFSLGGDIALLFPRGFAGGLGCFLLTHLCYSWSFFSFHALPRLASVGLPLAAAASVLLLTLWRNVPWALRIPVAVYIATITVMTTLAMGRAIALPTTQHICAAAGATFFFISDATLAMDRFHKPFHVARAIVRSTYFTGQFLIALSLSWSAG